MTGSISITADAINNLSDAGSAVVTLVGFKMAKKPADREHPYGHGRIEMCIRDRDKLLMAPSISPISNALAVPTAWALVPMASPFATG